MNGYERRSELKKHKIRTATLELLSAHGTDKISINEIAQKAGVAPASIYNYFGSKDGLINEAIKDLLEKGWKEREELWESDMPFPELIKHALSKKNEFIENFNLEFLGPIIRSNPEIKKLVDDFDKNRYPCIVSKFIKKGRSEGYIGREISVDAAILYLQMYQDALQNSEMLKNKDILKEIYDLMLYGLAGGPITEKKE